MIVKWLILSYSENSVVPTNIRVSPKLDINIGRLDFALKNVPIVERALGFSRSVRVSWSLQEAKPFLTLQFGPTFFENKLASEKLKIQTLPFKNIDFEKLSFELDAQNLRIDGHTIVENLAISGGFEAQSERLTDLSFIFKSVSSNDPDIWSTKLIESDIDELDLGFQYSSRPLIGSFTIEQLSSKKFGFDIAVSESEFSFLGNKLELLSNVRKTDLGYLAAAIDEIQIDGVYDLTNFIWAGNLDLKNGSFLKNIVKFSSLSTHLSKTDQDMYQGKFEGRFDPVEISMDGQYLATLPTSKLEGSVTINKALANIGGASELSLDLPGLTETVGYINMASNFNRWASILDCFHDNCQPNEFRVDYRLSLDDESISGQAKCFGPSCFSSGLSHSVQTSNTSKIFEKLSNYKILNPVVLVYLYSLFYSGDANGLGHTVNIN